LTQLAVRDYLATPDLALLVIRSPAYRPAYRPDFNPDEAIWARAREEMTANTCLGTEAKVQETVARFLDGLATRTAEVKSRCRPMLETLAEAVTAPALTSHPEAPYVDTIGASV
jgi:hypothetical protein